MPTLSQKINSALDAGIPPEEIVGGLKQVYPDFAPKIDAALAANITPDEIVSYYATQHVERKGPTPLQQQLDVGLHSQKLEQESYPQKLLRAAVEGAERGALGLTGYFDPEAISQTPLAQQLLPQEKSGAENFVSGLGEIASDFPAFIAGGAAGSAAGALAGPLGSAVAAGAGRMALPQVIKEARKAYKKYKEFGGPKTWTEFFSDFSSAALEVGIEAATGAVLGALGPAVKAAKLGKKTAKAAALAGEIGVLGGAHAAKKGELPTAEDWALTVAQLGVLKASGKAGSYILSKVKGSKVSPELKKAYDDLSDVQKQALAEYDINRSKFNDVLQTLKQNAVEEARRAESRGDKVSESEIAEKKQQYAEKREKAEKKSQEAELKLAEVDKLSKAEAAAAKGKKTKAELEKQKYSKYAEEKDLAGTFEKEKYDIEQKYKQKRKQSEELKINSEKEKSLLEKKLPDAQGAEKKEIQKKINKLTEKIAQANRNLKAYSEQAEIKTIERHAADAKKRGQKLASQIIEKAAKREAKALKENELSYFAYEIDKEAPIPAQQKKITRTLTPKELKGLPLDQVAKIYTLRARDEAKVRWRDTVAEKIKDAGSRTYRYWFDSTQPLKKLTEQTKSKVDLQSLHFNSKRAQALVEYRMKSGKLESITRERTGDIAFADAIEQAKPADFSYSELSDLLAAGASIDRQNLGLKNPMPTEIAEAIQKTYGPKYAKVYKEIQALQKETRDLLVANGVLSPEAVQAMEAAHKSYAPLYRVFEAGEIAAIEGQGSSGAKSFIKAAGDSLRQYVDPLESVIKNYEMAVKLAEKNKLATAIAKEYKKLGYKRQEAKSGVGAEEIAGGNRELTITLRELNDIYVPDELSEKTSLFFYENGKRYKIEGVDPAVANILKNPKPALGMMTKPVQALKGFVSKAKFTWSAVAMPYIQAKDFLVSAVSSPSMTTMAQYMMAYPVSVFQALKKTSKHWDAYERSGLYTHDYKNLSASDHALLASEIFDAANSKDKSIASRAKSVLKTPFRVLEAVDRTLTHANKLTSLKVELERKEYAGLPEPQKLAKAKAAIEKRLLNWQREGGGVLARAIAASTPIYTSTMQDMATIAHNIKNNPAFLPNAFAALTMPAIMAYAQVREDERYKRLPPEIKDKIVVKPWFGLFDDGKQDLWVIEPVWALGYATQTIPVRMMRYIDANDGPEELQEVLLEMAEGLAGELNPVSFWFGKKSGKPTKLERVSAEQQYTPNTPEVAKLISQLSGGHFSPYDIDQSLNRWFSGPYRDYSAVADELIYASGIADDRRPAYQDFSYKFLKRFAPTSADLRSSYLNKFYQLAEQEDKKASTLAILQARQDWEKAKKIQEEGYFKTGKARKNISNIFKKAFEIQNLPSSQISKAEREKILRDLALEMDETAKFYIEEIVATRKSYKE